MPLPQQVHTWTLTLWEKRTVKTGEPLGEVAWLPWGIGGSSLAQHWVSHKKWAHCEVQMDIPEAPVLPRPIPGVSSTSKELRHWYFLVP